MDLHQTPVGVTYTKKLNSLSSVKCHDARINSQFGNSVPDKELSCKGEVNNNNTSKKSCTDDENCPGDTTILTTLPAQQSSNKKAHQSHQTPNSSSEISILVMNRNSVKDRSHSGRAKRSKRSGRYSSQDTVQSRNRFRRNSPDPEEERVVKTNEIALFMRCKKRFGAPDFKPIPPKPGGWDEVKPDRVIAWEKTAEMFKEYSPFLDIKRVNDNETTGQASKREIPWETKTKDRLASENRHHAMARNKKLHQVSTALNRLEETSIQESTTSLTPPTATDVEGLEYLQDRQHGSADITPLQQKANDAMDQPWWSDRVWKSLARPQNGILAIDNCGNTSLCSHAPNSISSSNLYPRYTWKPSEGTGSTLNRSNFCRLDIPNKSSQQSIHNMPWTSTDVVSSQSTNLDDKNRRSLSYDENYHTTLQNLWKPLRQHSRNISRDYYSFKRSPEQRSGEAGSTAIWSPIEGIPLEYGFQPASQTPSESQYSDCSAYWKDNHVEQTDLVGVEDRFRSILKFVDEDECRLPSDQQYQHMTLGNLYQCRHCGALDHIIFRDCPFMPLLDAQQAWSAVLAACHRHDTNLFMESIGIYSKSQPNETLQTIAKKLREYGSGIQLLAVETPLPKSAAIVDLQGRSFCCYVAFPTIVEKDDTGNSSLCLFSHQPGYPLNWEQNMLRLSDAGFINDSTRTPTCHRCKQHGHWLIDCEKRISLTNNTNPVRRQFSNDANAHDNNYNMNGAYRLYYNMDDYVIVRNA
ncbi:hypothetical protein EC973_006598 [Apophysomyces ossiformis]|uniref:CCHC-type domain-containing protein n=1 Tax=Apophysomyces ossiformis TaxID=679940 RepID=A0A8H7BYR5_9FUNG|nr:hypothetical protein EC973_006598 [Apophysomyces ossiformis]